MKQEPSTQLAALPTQEMPAPPQREPGSLWSPDSNWNHLYSVSTFRTAGSFIFLNPSDRFHQIVEDKIAKMQQRLVKIPEKELEKLKKKKKTAKSKDKDKDKNKVSGRDESTIVGVIKEAHPRGIYSIVADHHMVVEEEEYQVLVEGKLREKTIAEDDSVSTDQLFDLRVTVPTLPVNLPDTAEDNTDKKDGKKTDNKTDNKTAKKQSDTKESEDVAKKEEKPPEKAEGDDSEKNTDDEKEDS